MDYIETTSTDEAPSSSPPTGEAMELKQDLEIARLVHNINVLGQRFPQLLTGSASGALRSQAAEVSTCALALCLSIHLCRPAGEIVQDSERLLLCVSRFRQLATKSRFTADGAAVVAFAHSTAQQVLRHFRDIACVRHVRPHVAGAAIPRTS